LKSYPIRTKKATNPLMPWYACLMFGNSHPQLNRYRTAAAFRSRLKELSIDLPLDERILSTAEGSPLAQPIEIFAKTVGNRWCVLPMEGWDGTEEGKPSVHTLRRWRKFGRSGAKLIYGGEAVAVRHDGRANPHQLLISPENAGDLADLLGALRRAHKESFGSDGDLLVGLQLTHSGRFSRPDPGGKPKPRILYHHPLLDGRVGIDPSDDSAVLQDEEIDQIIASFVKAAGVAAEIGFEFVDIKHCHGYLGHEFLSAHTRPGRYGGALENRTRFVREIIQGIRRQVHIGSGYSYLQQFLPLVAQATVRENWISCVGIGREVLSYPELPSDTLAGRPLRLKSLCRTFSDCSTGPRNGLISGCYPLDPYYKKLTEAQKVKRLRSIER